MVKIYKFYLDAGHGKNTVGKCSPNGDVLEWDLNNKVCLFVANNLAKYNCVVYRCDDTTGETDPLPTSSRLAIAIDGNADACISVHHNIAGDGSFKSGENATGVEVFIAKDYTEESRQLGALILHNLVANTGMRNRGLKAASNITMCTKETFPTILVEGGFLNNRRDIEYINSDKGVKAYAKAISSALIQTFNLTKDFPGTALEQKTSSSEYVVSTSYENTTRYICKDKVLASAITICDKNGGTKVFDDEGNVLHTSKLEAPTVSYPRVKIGSKGDKKMSYGQTLKMRDEPSAKSGSIITEIAYGETLALVSKANDAFWLCETLDGKFRGYMHSAYLNEINS